MKKAKIANELKDVLTEEVIWRQKCRVLWLRVHRVISHND
jgi:hypothetical protein